MLFCFISVVNIIMVDRCCMRLIAICIIIFFFISDGIEQIYWMTVSKSMNGIESKDVINL